MHDGTDDPTELCALCGEDVYLGDMVQCRDCENWYCDRCKTQPEACQQCDDCGDTVCERSACGKCAADFCEECSTGHHC